MEKGLTNRLLGYPPDARLLIVNADDFGMCASVNAAIVQALEAGLARSTSLMVPCPWAAQAEQFLAARPEIACGVHLTAMSDPAGYRWGPLTCRERVPSLVDRAGFFYNFADVHARLDRLKPDELELEFRAQIEAALAAGLKPAHLDWHALRISGRADLLDLLFKLARGYGLALRVMGRAFIEQVQGRGLPTIDRDFLDSYSLDPAARPAQYARLLRELPEGLSEWAVHPGLDNLELRAIEAEGSRYRQADFDFWTSPEARALVKQEGILLVDYRALQKAWRSG